MSQDVPTFTQFLVNWLPMLLLIAAWVFFMREMQRGGKGGLSQQQYLAEILKETRRHNEAMEKLIARLDESFALVANNKAVSPDKSKS